MLVKMFANNRVEGWKKILIIAWPLIVSNSFWNIQLTVDRMFLSYYSTESLGASMAVNGVFWVFMALLQQTAAYVMTFVAQYYGAKKLEMIGPSVWQAIYLSVIGGLLMLICIPLAKPLFAFFGHSATMQELEVAYFKTLIYSAMPTALVAVVTGFYTGLGHTKIILWINAVGVAFNIVFDYVMIFGHFGFPAMGIAGAGYATAIANLAAAIYGFYLLFTREHEKLYSILSGWRYNIDLMKRFIKYGVPSGMQWALEGLAFTVFLLFIGRMKNGDAALAASGIAVTIMMLSVLPPIGIAQAVSVLVGQFVGEKKPESAVSATWSGLQVSLMYIISLGISFVLFSNFFVSWFHNPANPELWSEVSTIASYLLMFVAFFTMFDSMNFNFSFALKGAGDTRFVTLIALTLPWPIMVLPTWLTVEMPGAIYWAWGAASIYGITQAIIFWRRFEGGKWKQMNVIGLT